MSGVWKATDLVQLLTAIVGIIGVCIATYILEL